MADVLVEREDSLASLERLLGEALDGHGRLVFLGGEAGVGKTALATALAEAAGGLVVRRGSCDSVTTAEALGPILDALPELAVAADNEAGAGRLRLFRKVRDVLASSPMLLLLEDVHWADEATLDILRFLGRRLAGARLMILATFRSEEVGGDHPLTVVMGDLAAQAGVIRMQLPALSVTGVRQLLADAGSALDAGDVYQRRWLRPGPAGWKRWSAYALAFSPKTGDARECLDVLDRLGASAVRHAVLRARHTQGLTVPRGPRPTSRANPAGLTARELEVLGLLADGMSYAEVAERLVLSEKTVGHHVSAVLRKLSEPTRSRAVATAMRLGIIPPR